MLGKTIAHGKPFQCLPKIKLHERSQPQQNTQSFEPWTSGLLAAHQHGLHDVGDHVQLTGSKYHLCADAHATPLVSLSISRSLSEAYTLICIMSYWAFTPDYLVTILP